MRIPMLVVMICFLVTGSSFFIPSLSDAADTPQKPAEVYKQLSKDAFEELYPGSTIDGFMLVHSSNQVGVHGIAGEKDILMSFLCQPKSANSPAKCQAVGEPVEVPVSGSTI